MHYKHNQIFTDHDIPNDAIVIRFDVKSASWDELHDALYGEEPTIQSQGSLKAA